MTERIPRGICSRFPAGECERGGVAGRSGSVKSPLPPTSSDEPLLVEYPPRHEPIRGLQKRFPGVREGASFISRQTFRDEGDKLQHKETRGDAGDLRGVVERRAVANDVRADEVQATESVDNFQDLAEPQAVQLGIGDAGSLARIDHIEIEGEVGGMVADDRESPFQHGLRPQLEEGLRGDEFREIFLRPIIHSRVAHGASHADLDGAIRIDDPILGGKAERAGMVAGAQEGQHRVVVAVEMDQSQGLRESGGPGRAKDRSGDRVVPAHAHGDDAGSVDFFKKRLDILRGRVGVQPTWHGYVAEVANAHQLEGIDAKLAMGAGIGHGAVPNPPGTEVLHMLDRISPAVGHAYEADVGVQEFGSIRATEEGGGAEPMLVAGGEIWSAHMGVEGMG